MSCLILQRNAKLTRSDPAAASNAAKASIAISCARPLQSAFGPILGALVATMGASIIALRSKALKGLSTIVTVDPDVLAKVSSISL